MKQERTNRLAGEKSPYLLQHAHNPVDWYPWSQAAFEQARTSNKPVFVSVGYSSCHWCHVMAHESFEDDDVASVLNRCFISIKVDREEMPDVDHFCMAACQAMTGGGGWPLSCFLTPDKKPFYAGTYFPKEQFIPLLETVAKQWDTNREQLLTASEGLLSALAQKRLKAQKAGTTTDKAVKSAFSNLQTAFDAEYGGFGRAPKFPSAQNILFLIRYYWLAKDEQARIMIEKTLDCMYNGGIFDHIGGGFSRYSTDRHWLVPHFEKMMVDNAMLAMAYTEAGAALDRKYFTAARRILDYCFNDMYGGGAFYTAEDADSEGIEGKYYLFTPEEIVGVLGKERGDRFCACYNITPEGNFEGKSIPNRIGSADSASQIPAEDLQRVLEYRRKRVPPFKDDKHLTAVNGLMLAALATAARYIGDQYRKPAEELAHYILEHLSLENRLHTGGRDGALFDSMATLDDCAYVLWGLFELYQATLTPRWLDEAIRLANQILALFADGDTLYLTGSDVQNLPLRTQSLYDGALPAGAGVAVYVFYRLSAVSDDQKYDAFAQRFVQELSPEISAYPAAFISLLWSEMFRIRGGMQVTLTHGRGREEMEKIKSVFSPFATLHSEDRDTGKAEAHLCYGGACRPPEQNPDTIMQALAKY